MSGDGEPDEGAYERAEDTAGGQVSPVPRGAKLPSPDASRTGRLLPLRVVVRAWLREREAAAQVLRVEADDLTLRRDALRQKMLDAEVVCDGYRRLPALDGALRRSWKSSSSSSRRLWRSWSGARTPRTRRAAPPSSSCTSCHAP